MMPLLKVCVKASKKVAQIPLLQVLQVRGRHQPAGKAWGDVNGAGKLVFIPVNRRRPLPQCRDTNQMAGARS